MLYLSPAVTACLVVMTAITGVCLGSFLNCWAWRLAHGESIVKGRSHCAVCKHTLGFLDLVPVFNYIFLRGKCRYCGEKISPRYLLTELLTALTLICLLFRYDFSVDFARFAILLCLLIVVALVDLETQIIPDRLIIAGIAVFLVFTLFQADKPGYLLWGIVGGFSIALPLLLLVLLADKVLKRETMGGGDIKLIFMIGLFFDWKINLFHIILSCVAGLALAVVLVKAKPNTPFPFGPAICIAAFICMLCGEQFVSWYFGLLG